eukprot:TRINITY_DN5303_c0_g1_i13.p1 TRINITY_DN5303_c0_g1~~TRINITY_DN5303_c0_g1_i13.p1  ORF type:complete len:329 (+),score=106.72 TRINITY_DN5303_c0_g1_i13:665-1651(+)
MNNKTLSVAEKMKLIRALHAAAHKGTGTVLIQESTTFGEARHSKQEEDGLTLDEDMFHLMFEKEMEKYENREIKKVRHHRPPPVSLLEAGSVTTRQHDEVNRGGHQELLRLNVDIGKINLQAAEQAKKTGGQSLRGSSSPTLSFNQVKEWCDKLGNMNDAEYEASSKEKATMSNAQTMASKADEKKAQLHVEVEIESSLKGRVQGLLRLQTLVDKAKTSLEQAQAAEDDVVNKFSAVSQDKELESKRADIKAVREALVADTKTLFVQRAATLKEQAARLQEVKTAEASAEEEARQSHATLEQAEQSFTHVKEQLASIRASCQRLHLTK